MLKKKTSGAYSSISTVQKKVSGAWSKVSAVQKKVSGAWSTVWMPPWTWTTASGRACYTTWGEGFLKAYARTNSSYQEAESATLESSPISLKSGDKIGVTIGEAKRTGSGAGKIQIHIGVSGSNLVICSFNQNTTTLPNGTYTYTMPYSYNNSRFEMLVQKDAYSGASLEISCTVTKVTINGYQMFPKQ